MPELKTVGFDAAAAMWMKEADARLVGVTNFEGLQGMQVLREWCSSADRGLMMAQAPVAGEKLDWCADANGVADPSTISQDCGLQGAKRYVENPIVEHKQFPGKFVGGPLKWLEKPSKEGRDGARVVQQLLTRVRSLTAGAVVAGLKAVRPEGIEALKYDKPYREDLAAGATLTLRFRHFTHESRGAVETLTRANMRLIVAHHLGAGALGGWQAAGVAFVIDAETNAGIVELNCVRVESYATLAAAPVTEMPATRTTLRMFGLRSDASGEGYRYERVYRWEHLARSLEASLQYPVDLTMLATYVDKLTYAGWSSGVTGAFKEAGRVWKGFAGTAGANFAADLASGRVKPWWRVAEYKLDEDDAGLLSFTMVVAHPEWTNVSDSATERVENPVGWGRGIVETLPSVPRGAAESIMESAPEMAGHVLSGTSATEAGDGAADVSRNYRRVWSYTSDDKPVMPTHGALTAPEVSVREIGEGDGGAAVSYPSTALASVGDVAVAAAAQLVAKSSHYLDGVQVSVDGAGVATVRAEATREAAHEMPEYMARGDYFSETYLARLFNSTAVPTGGLQEDHSILSVEKSKTPHGNYNISKTKDVPKARSWVTTYVVDALNGELRVVTAYHYRNWAVQPAQPTLTQGMRGSADFRKNNYELWDGEYTVSPNDTAWESVRTDVDYFGTTVATTLSNRATAIATVASQSVNALVAVDKSVSTSGLHGSTVTTRTGTPRSWVVEHTPDALGVAGRTVKDTAYRNQATVPTVPTVGTGRRVSASLLANELGSWDGQVQEAPDDREKQSVTTSVDAFSSRVSTRTSNRAEAVAAVAALAESGKLTEVTLSEALSGIHSAVVDEITPVAQDFEYTYTVKNRGRSGTGTVHVYYNQTTRVAATEVIGYQVTPSWQMNRHKLWDGTISTMPTFYSEVASTISDAWSETKKWLEARHSASPDANGDGNDYRLVTESSDWKVTTDKSSANSFAAGGKSGSASGRHRDGLYWGKKVTNITYGSWAGTKAGAE